MGESPVPLFIRAGRDNMNNTVFIIPGYHDSEPAHWQSWLQRQIPGSARLSGVDWNWPDLNSWVDQAHKQVAVLDLPVWLVAHSFGSLVAATLAAEMPQRIAGILFVAPADPQRFAASGGLRNTRFDATSNPVPSVADIMPYSLPAALPSALIASDNDPWLSFAAARSMARRWHSHFVSIGSAGHVNTAAGFGPWPGLLQQLQLLRHQAQPDFSGLTRAALKFDQGNPPAQTAAANAPQFARGTGAAVLHFTI
jgi:predicted alpha/beta hydrolase family esterase